MRWFTKINQATFSYILICLLFIFLAIGFHGDSSLYFVGNLTPEITGVIIELLVVLWVFNKWQELSIRKKLISLERRLREYLIFFLRHNFKTLPKEYRVGNFFGENHHENIQYLNNLRIYIQKNELGQNEFVAIQNHCIREASTLSNLLPVASELTNAHFKAWCRIVYFVNDISMQSNSGSIDEKAIKTATINILQNIKKFDNASYERKLYVGADIS